MTFLIVLAAAAIAGTWIIRPLRLGDRLELQAYRLLAGLAVCGLFILASSPFLTLSGAFQVLLIVALAGWGWELFIKARDRYYREPVSHAIPKLTRWEYGALALIAVCGAMALLGALAPPTDGDVLNRQLSLAAQDAASGRIQAHPNTMFGPPSPMMHVFYAMALHNHEEYAANLFSWLYGMLALAAVCAAGARLGGRSCGILAAALLAITPLFFTQSSTAHFDLAFAAYTTASLACLMAWREEKHFGWVFLGALFTGSAASVQPAGYALIPVFALVVFLSTKTHCYRLTMSYLAGAVVISLPWFFYEFVPTPDTNPFTHLLERYESLAFARQGESPRDRFHAAAMFPWDVVMRPMVHGGWSHSVGPLVLVLGVPALVASRRELWRVGAFCIASGAVLYFVSADSRTVLPAIAPMFAVAAHGVLHLRPLRWLTGAVVALACVAGMVYHGVELRLRLPVVTGAVSRDAYLEAHVPRYPVYRWINRNIPENATLISFDPLTYYLERPVYGNATALGTLRGRALAGQLHWLKDHDVRYLVHAERLTGEDPGFRRSGATTIVKRWLERPEHFVLIQEFEFGGGSDEPKERVRIYEIHHD